MELNILATHGADQHTVNVPVVESVVSLAEGVNVTVADNGELAVQVLEQNPARFQAVLMDLQMPVMDGYLQPEFVAPSTCELRFFPSGSIWKK